MVSSVPGRATEGRTNAVTANTIMPVRKRTTAANPRAPAERMRRHAIGRGVGDGHRTRDSLGRWQRSGRTPGWAAASGREDGSGIRLFFCCSSVVLHLSGRSSRWPQSSPAREPNPSTSAPESSWTDVHARPECPPSRGTGQILVPGLKGRTHGLQGVDLVVTYSPGRGSGHHIGSRRPSRGPGPALQSPRLVFGH